MTKLHVPDDISLLAFDDPDYATCLNPGLTVWRQDIEGMVREAVKQLFARLNGEPMRGYEAEATLIERQSCCRKAEAEN